MFGVFYIVFSSIDRVEYDKQSLRNCHLELRLRCSSSSAATNRKWKSWVHSQTVISCHVDPLPHYILVRRFTLSVMTYLTDYAQRRPTDYTVQVHNQVGLLQSLFSAAESSLTSQSGFSIDFKRPKFSRCVLNAACSETDSRINPAEDHCRAGYPCRRHPPGGAVGEIHETTSYGRNKNYWTPGGANK